MAKRTENTIGDELWRWKSGKYPPEQKLQLKTILNLYETIFDKNIPEIFNKLDLNGSNTALKIPDNSWHTTFWEPQIGSAIFTEIRSLIHLAASSLPAHFSANSV